MINKGYIVFFKSLAGKLFLSVLVFLLPLIAKAQQEKKYIREGNTNYQDKKYGDAEKNYKQALSKNKNSYKANFNLGDAYYKQGKYKEAAEQFQNITHVATSKDTLAKAYHNLGNALLKAKQYQESVEAYKNALKNNPNDADTRYNLAVAQQYLKQQQQQQQKQKDQDKKDDKKDQNKDKKDQDKKDKKDQDKKDDQKKDQQKKDQQKPEQDKNQISKQDAQRLLDALQNDEKNLQDKLKKGKPAGVKVQIEKDW